MLLLYVLLVFLGRGNVVHRGGAWRWYHKRYHAYIRSVLSHPLPSNDDINTGWVYINDSGEWDYIFDKRGVSDSYSKRYVEWYKQNEKQKVKDTWILIHKVQTQVTLTKAFIDDIFIEMKKIL